MTVKLPSAIVRQNAILKQYEAPLEDEVEVVEEEVEQTKPEVPEPKQKSPEELAKYWEHRFNTLRGIADAERNKLSQELKAREEKLDALQTQIVNIEKSIPRQYDLRKYLSEEELENVDVHQLQTAIRLATDSSTEEFEKVLNSRVAPIEAELKKTKENAEKLKSDAFWDTLESVVPDWEPINGSPAFHNWLGFEDEVTGVSRQNALQAAQQALNVRRVIAIFNAFKKEDGNTRKLERKVVPSGVSSQAPTGNDGIVALSSKHIREFYEDVRRGKYAGRQKEMLEFERKIKAAYDNNRVVD
jgi:hypothetical protein